MVDKQTSSRRRGRRIASAAIIVLGTLTVLAAPAFGAVSITSYKITSDLPAFPTTPANGPSTVVAGGHPDAGSYSVFGYPDSTEDLETAITNFGPGLLGNPESVPKCSQALLEAGGTGCPAGSQIGTSRLDVKLASTSPGGSPIAGFSGTLYNAELLGDEPGRLAAVTSVAGSTLVSSIPFTITPRPGGDYGLTGTLTDIARLDAVQLGPPLFIQNLQTYALSFIINGSANGYVRNPTSCEANISTGNAHGYDDPTVVGGPAYEFATIGCEQLPFAPKMSLTIGDRGSTAFNKYPPLVFKITQAAGEADEMGNKVTLPVELNTNNTAYTLCSQAQADSDTCPAASKFGWATAKSPFLSEPVQGPIYLIQQTATSLPGLLLDLQGRAHVKVQTKTTLINNKAIQSLVLNAPQLPVSELTVALNGGRKTGVFLNRSDLCFKGDSTSRFKSVHGLVKSYGWNGTQTADTKLDAAVLGCGPAVRTKLRGASGLRPSLKLTVTKHPDSPNIKSLRIRLSRNLNLNRTEITRGSATASATKLKLKYVNHQTLRVTGFPTAGAGKVTIRLRKRALRVSRRSRHLLARGHSRRFKVKVRPTPVSGTGTTTAAEFKVKGRR